MTRHETGAEGICRAIESAGIDCVFGLPGTQTVGLYEAIRRSKLRAIVPTHELGATFMAMGYARLSGKPGILLTIPGPGFAYALAGLAEAKLDGVALVHITLSPAKGPTGEPAFQAIDQIAIAEPLVKKVFLVKDRSLLVGALQEAMQLALESERGPVFVQIDEAVLSASGPVDDAPAHAPATRARDELDGVLAQVRKARRPLILLATDCSGSSTTLGLLANAARIPICVPPPSRGVLPEDHAWCVCFDDQRSLAAEFNALLARSDLILLAGTQMGHVSTSGFRLSIPPDRTISVAACGSPELPHGYAAHAKICGDPHAFFESLSQMPGPFASEWTVEEIGAVRSRLTTNRPSDPPEPVIDSRPAADFFRELRSVVPREAIVVTDSGLHQVMVRRFYEVLEPRGLLFPSDFQSMGFGLPAAIGAKLAQATKPVVAIVGDGGFAMNGLELITAVRDRIPIILLVMNDGKLNLIRVQQIREFGRTYGVDLQGADLQYLAASVGARYSRTAGDFSAVFGQALSSGEVCLIDIPVGDSPSIQQSQLKSLVRESVRNAIGPNVVGWLKRKLRR